METVKNIDILIIHDKHDKATYLLLNLFNFESILSCMKLLFVSCPFLTLVASNTAPSKERMFWGKINIVKIALLRE